jgi:hypothetical protein
LDAIWACSETRRARMMIKAVTLMGKGREERRRREGEGERD